MKMISDYAAKLFEAETNVKAISSFAKENPSFTVEQGYQVQKHGLELRLAKGETLAGYKMGLTSLAKQRDVKVFEPICGYLLKSKAILKNQPISVQGKIHPRVEPEIAVILDKPLKGNDVSLSDVVAASRAIVPALEILDSRFDGFQFSLPDVVADNTSACGYVLGSGNLLPQVKDLAHLGVVMKHNGVIVETGAPAAVLGDPLLSVVGLAKLLAKENRGIEAGMVIMTGGITASLPFKAGDVVEVSFPDETLSFRAH